MATFIHRLDIRKDPHFGFSSSVSRYNLKTKEDTLYQEDSLKSACTYISQKGQNFLFSLSLCKTNGHRRRENVNAPSLKTKSSEKSQEINTNNHISCSGCFVIVPHILYARTSWIYCSCKRISVPRDILPGLSRRALTDVNYVSETEYSLVFSLNTDLRAEVEHHHLETSLEC